MDDGQNVNGVSLREYIELLIDAKTETIKVQMAERLTAMMLAAEQHQSEHRVIEKDMEHLNQLRQEVTQDRERLTPLPAFNTYKESISGWMKIIGDQYSGIRGQMLGAAFVIGLIPTVIAIYAVVK